MYGENSACNTLISVFQLVDLDVLFELVKGIETKTLNVQDNVFI
jgi:hypothetical protein